MKIGYTVWSWTKDEFSGPTDHGKRDFEQALKEVSYLGYNYVEDFNFIVPLFENNPEELKQLLNRYNLELVNLYHTYYEDEVNKYLDLGERTCKILQYCGAKVLNVQGNIWKDQPFVRSLDIEAVKMYADVFTKMGEISQKYDITTCLHPHAHTRMFHEDEIDCFLSITDRNLIGLTMDTAHTTLAGMDAVKAFDKYGDRIQYVHLKDLDPDPEAHADWPMNRFLALGQGVIDFKGVIKVLKKHNYKGVLCVELDCPLVCNFESAQYSRRYIKDVLAL